jgi:general secretion pathway protein D
MARRKFHFALLAVTVIAPLAALASCDWRSQKTPTVDLSPIGSTIGPPPEVSDPGRISGPVSTTAPGREEPIIRQDGRPVAASQPRAGGGTRENRAGEFTLDYVDTDIKEIVRVILGTMLHVNYIIEPSVQGTATVQTSSPVSRDALLPILSGLLAQNGATLTYQNDVYRIGTMASAATALPVLPSGTPGAGSQLVLLRYASAARLAQLLEPYAGQTSRVQADTTRNALVVTGTAAARENLIDLIRVFDVDYLAGQSYALFPMKSSDAKNVAKELQKIFQANAGDAGPVNIMPIERANAILVITAQPAYIDRVGKLIGELDQAQTISGRQLHVYYVQNGQAADLQPVLQRAFAPAGAQGGGPGSLSPTGEASEIGGPEGARTPQQQASLGGTQSGVTATSPQPNASFTGTTPGIGGLGTGTSTSSARTGSTGSAAFAPDSDDTSAQREEGTRGGSQGDGIRIIVDRKKNALLILATEAEYSAIEATIRKLDVLPLQVLIEATIAEVTLNDQLQYGTQFFLTRHRIATGLTEANGATISGGSDAISKIPGLSSGFLQSDLPGAIVSGAAGSVQYAIQALQSVTDVKVVASPKLLILDNEKARLQVGALVPVITQSATSVVTTGAPVVDSVDYRETGVILNVRPRVNSGGLVTVDIEQEVSDVTTTTSSTINSPTFNQRKIQSRIVVQDGDTIALAGLIQDNTSVGNAGIPLLKDIPVLGALFSTRNHSDVRTELLVMITPRVMHDQRDARVLTEELRQKLGSAGNLLAPPPPKQPGT